MIRIVAENTLLFLLPSIIYFGYMTLVRRDAPSGERIVEEAPLLWLFLAGVGLVLATLIAFGTTTGGTPEQGYQPPVLNEDGIEPGRLK